LESNQETTFRNIYSFKPYLEPTDEFLIEDYIEDFQKWKQEILQELRNLESQDNFDLGDLTLIEFVKEIFDL